MGSLVLGSDLVVSRRTELLGCLFSCFFHGAMRTLPPLCSMNVSEFFRLSSALVLS